MKRLYKKPVSDWQNEDIYTGLHGISGKNRERLKSIAQSLILVQNHLGIPLSDSVSQKISEQSTKESFSDAGKTDSSLWKECL